MQKSDVETEQRNVAILHDVVFAFAANQTLLLACGHGAQLLQRFKGHDLRTDKALFKVGVDLAGSLRRFGTFLDRPSTAFIFAGSQEGNQSQQTIERGNQTIQTALTDA